MLASSDEENDWTEPCWRAYESRRDEATGRRSRGSRRCSGEERRAGWRNGREPVGEAWLVEETTACCTPVKRK